MSRFAAALWVVALIDLAIIAVIDVKRRIIPNELALLTAGVGLALRLVTAGSTLWLSVIVAAVIFLMLGVAAHFGAIGGGDVKLIPATTLLVPAGAVFSLLLDIAMAGGMLSLFYLMAARCKRTVTLLPAQATPRGRSGDENPLSGTGSDDSLPYGLAIFIGVAFFFVDKAVGCFYGISCSL